MPGRASGSGARGRTPTGTFGRSMLTRIGLARHQSGVSVAGGASRPRLAAVGLQDARILPSGASSRKSRGLELGRGQGGDGVGHAKLALRRAPRRADRSGRGCAQVLAPGGGELGERALGAAGVVETRASVRSARRAASSPRARAASRSASARARRRSSSAARPVSAANASAWARSVSARSVRSARSSARRPRARSARCSVCRRPARARARARRVAARARFAARRGSLGDRLALARRGELALECAAFLAQRPRPRSRARRPGPSPALGSGPRRRRPCSARPVRASAARTRSAAIASLRRSRRRRPRPHRRQGRRARPPGPSRMAASGLPRAGVSSPASRRSPSTSPRSRVRVVIEPRSPRAVRSWRSDGAEPAFDIQVSIASATSRRVMPAGPGRAAACGCGCRDVGPGRRGESPAGATGARAGRSRARRGTGGGEGVRMPRSCPLRYVARYVAGVATSCGGDGVREVGVTGH